MHKKITKEMLMKAVNKVKRKVWIWDEAKEQQDNWKITCKPAQYRLPEIKIVGDMSEEDKQDTLDAIIAFLVKKYLKDYYCHVFRFKGKTYIRVQSKKLKLDEEALEDFDNKVDKLSKTTAMPLISIHPPAERTVIYEPDGTITDRYSRRNNDRYKKKKKWGK